MKQAFRYGSVLSGEDSVLEADRVAEMVSRSGIGRVVSSGRTVPTSESPLFCI